MAINPLQSDTRTDKPLTSRFQATQFFREADMNQQTLIKRDVISTLSLFLVLLCASGITFGQDIVTKGGISGHVTDSAGAVIPNAKVTISGQAGTRTTTTDAQGEFEVLNLIPG